MVEKDGILWHPVGDGRIVCDACNRRCSIPEGSHGFCYVRKNAGGRLRLSVYGKLAAMQIDPIEKKPFNHFHPGTHVFTVGTISCNWHCHPAGTKITLADGTAKNVESLVAGDALWSYDVTGAEMSESKARANVVTEIRTRKAELWALWWGGTKPTQRKKSRRKTLITGDHPVLTRFGWKQVADIRPGEYILRVYPQVGSRRRELQRQAGSDYGPGKNTGRLRKSLHAHPSRAQSILYEVLDKMGVEYEREYTLKLAGLPTDSQTKYVLDAAFPELKLDIEVDGWLRFDERIKKRDAFRDATLQLNGWRVVRIPGSAVYNHAEWLRELISAQLRAQPMANDKHWVRVLDVKPTGQTTTVYGLECIPNHTYVADGILVHNCLFCQNHAISKETDAYGEDVPPERVPQLAAENDCEGVGFSYNEPTIFVEYVIDAAREAHRLGKYTVFVTNGYGTVECVRAIKGYVDAVVVDYKGSGEELFQRRQTMTVSAEPIKQTLLELKAQKIHTELTDLIIPQVGADLDEAKRLCNWLHDNLGPDVPLQFTRFHPDYRMLDIPVTPYEVLLKHHEAATSAGLNYAYIGNVPGSPQEHTYCPGCRRVVIERHGFMITGWNLDAHYRCRDCGHSIPIEGKRASRLRYRGIESFYIPNPG